MARCEYHGCMIQDGNFLLTEFYRCEALYFDKGTENNFNIKFSRNVKIRRFLRSRLRL